MKLPGTFAKGKKTVNVIIETPRGSSNKFNYDPGTGFFKLGKVLPAGMVFPMDFGFIPGTKGEDGDPLDVLLLMEQTTYPGCLVESRIIGVIRVKEEGKGERSLRNDRFLAVPVESVHVSNVKRPGDLNENEMDEIMAFLRQYKKIEGSETHSLGVKGARKAMRMIKKKMT